jgi:hypothetical protein
MIASQTSIGRGRVPNRSSAGVRYVCMIPSLAMDGGTNKCMTIVMTGLSIGAAYASSAN